MSVFCETHSSRDSLNLGPTSPKLAPNEPRGGFDLAINQIDEENLPAPIKYTELRIHLLNASYRKEGPKAGDKNSKYMT